MRWGSASPSNSPRSGSLTFPRLQTHCPSSIEFLPDVSLKRRRGEEFLRNFRRLIIGMSALRGFMSAFSRTLGFQARFGKGQTAPCGPGDPRSGEGIIAVVNI